MNNTKHTGGARVCVPWASKRSSLALCGIALLVAILLGSGITSQKPAAPQVSVSTLPVAMVVPATGVVLRAVESVKSETLATFDTWLTDYVAASEAKRSELEAQGVKLALARKAVMSHLIETDPEQALKQAMSVVQKRSLPQSVREHIEEDISSEGQLVTLIATEFGPQSNATVSRQATIGNKTYEAFTYGRLNDVRLDNKTIPLNGIALDRKLAVNESPLRLVEPGEFEPAVLAAARTQSRCSVCSKSAKDNDDAVAVLKGSKIVYVCQGVHMLAYGDELLSAALVGEPDIQPSPWTEGGKTLIYISIYYKDQTNAPVKTDMTLVNAYFVTNSYNKTTITTTFTPAYQMSKNAMDYTTLAEIVDEARALAAAGGYNYLSYDLDTIRYNGGFGTFGGVAGVGGRNNMLKTEAPGVAAHEIGHNYGLWHANFWQTTDGTTLGPGGNEEYGNFFDVMGSSGSFPQGHFNAYKKNKMDWLPTTNITSVSTSGTYRIYAHDMATLSAGNKYGITFVKDADKTYWVEYRQHPGWTSAPWLTNGVTLLWDPWGTGEADTTNGSHNGSQLLDTTPGSVNGKNDAPIVLGRTFSDTAKGVHFTLMGRGGTSPNLWADVVVNVGTFPGNASPTLSLAASSTTVTTNTVVNFTATASDSNGDTLAYHWDFGDTTFGTNGLTATKSWTTTGSRRITCIVSDMKGGTATQAVYVNVVNSGTYAISGTVTNSGAPQAGVVVSDGTRTGTTDSFGNYAIINVPNGTYTLTPTLIGTVFTPVTLTNIAVSGGSLTGKNFSATTLLVPTNGPGVGITREWWTGVSGATVADLINTAAYPNSPTGTETVVTLFEAPLDWGGSYGQRMHGYFIAPVTGNYRFYIASDDNSELWLSTNSSTGSVVKIASVTDWTNSRQWDKYASQKSAAKALVAGQRYYIRALHKEGSGGDNLAVGVEYPNGSVERPIPFHRLDPWPSVTWTTVSQASVNESGSLTVTAQLSVVSSQNVTVPFAVTGTASGADYSITASPITIAAGATTGSVTITITNDVIQEANGETVILTMGTLTNASYGAIRVHTATITDDDNTAPVVYAGADYSVPLSSGTPWSPSQLGPQLWIDATTASLNAGTVTVVNAGSGGGSLSGPASLTNGINALQTVRFTGGSQRLNGSYTNKGPALTAFLVGKASTNSQTAWTGMMSVWTAATSADYNNSGSAVLLGQNSSTANSIYSQRVSALSLTNGPLTNTFLAATVFDGSMNTLFLNGTPANSLPSAGNFATANVVLGCRWDTAFNKGWKGDLGETIICNTNLSVSDRQKIEGYLAHKWGVTNSLPAGHPYKIAAPRNCTVNLDGTVSDGDDNPFTTAWTLVSGPVPVTIASPSSVDTTATLSAIGTYIFRLTANDGYGPVSDDVVITVAVTNIPVTQYTITVATPSKGTITPSGAVSVLSGGRTNFVITPDAHYSIAAVTTNGAAVTISNPAGFTYTWNNVRASGTIAALFQRTRTITNSVPTEWLATAVPASTNNYEAAAAADPDLDGYTTAQEYWSGTDPLNNGSFLKFDSLEMTGTNAILKWSHARVDAGLPPITIQARTNLVSGTWGDIGTKAPTNGVNTWTLGSSVQGFYRLTATNAP
jgi:hypothetical protein